MRATSYFVTPRALRVIHAGYTRIAVGQMPLFCFLHFFPLPFLFIRILHTRTRIPISTCSPLSATRRSSAYIAYCYRSCAYIGQLRGKPLKGACVRSAAKITFLEHTATTTTKALRNPEAPQERLG